jgi:hypothetical protein
MPTSTLAWVIGSWIVLAALSGLAYRFNRNRGND